MFLDSWVGLERWFKVRESSLQCYLEYLCPCNPHASENQHLLLVRDS